MRSFHDGTGAGAWRIFGQIAEAANRQPERFGFDAVTNAVMCPDSIAAHAIARYSKVNHTVPQRGSREQLGSGAGVA
ncbi:hypothetical protein C8K36_104104 [Rhodococcus sp. OK519]|nr:hypothetical protein C8K36_104104 [Rhodococcus sp. OK519]